jgi:hypothetical protein
MKKASVLLCLAAAFGLGSCAMIYEILGKYPAPWGVTASKDNGVHPEYVLVSWSAVDGAETYGIGRSTDLSDYAEEIAQSGETSYKDYDAEPGRSHYYVVFVAKPQGIGLQSWKNDRSAEVEGRPPATGAVAAPQNFWASNGTYTGRIQVGWYSVPEADYYVLYREESDSASSGGFRYVFLSRFEKPAANAKCEFTLPSSEAYGTYAVRACGNNGISDLSNRDYGYWH